MQGLDPTPALVFREFDESRSQIWVCCYARDVDREDAVFLQTVGAVAQRRADESVQPLSLSRELPVALRRLIAVLFPAEIARTTERTVQGVSFRHEVLTPNLMEFDLQSASSKLFSHRYEFRSHPPKTVHCVG